MRAGWPLGPRVPLGTGRQRRPRPWRWRWPRGRRLRLGGQSGLVLPSVAVLMDDCVGLVAMTIFSVQSFPSVATYPRARCPLGATREPGDACEVSRSLVVLYGFVEMVDRTA